MYEKKEIKKICYIQKYHCTQKEKKSVVWRFLKQKKNTDDVNTKKTKWPNGFNLVAVTTAVTLTLRAAASVVYTVAWLAELPGATLFFIHREIRT